MRAPVSMRASWWRTAGAITALLCVLATAPVSRSIAATEPSGPEEILECVRMNRPITNTVRTLEIKSRDRVGKERVTRTVIYGGLSREGLRTLLVRATHPPDLRGMTLLITERAGANEMFISPAGLPEVKQIRGGPAQGRFFGTDFSYEDLQRLLGMSLTSDVRRLPDGEAEGRPSWVVEIRPAEGSGSAYERIVSHVDQETCAVLRSELYEHGAKPRKLLISRPAEVRQEGRVWVAHDVLMRDLRDGTETRIVVESIELGASLPDVPFSARELEAKNRSE